MNNSNLKTINSVSNNDIFIIADIIIESTSEIIVSGSYDDKLIVLTILDKIKGNKVFILSKVGNFYIKEAEILIDDNNISDKFGENVEIIKHNNEYIIAISDSEYLSSNGIDKVGCVFLYKFLPNKGWSCIKELTLLDGNNEIKYNNFGEIIDFVKEGLVVSALNRDRQILFLFKTTNFLHFNKQELETIFTIIKDRSKLLELNVTSDGCLVSLYLELDSLISDGSKRYLLKYKIL